MRYIRDDLPKRLKRSARTPKRRHLLYSHVTKMPVASVRTAVTLRAHTETNEQQLYFSKMFLRTEFINIKIYCVINSSV